MKWYLIRSFRGEKYSIGHLYDENKNFLCDTLEDIDRGLTQSMSTDEIAKIKVKGETAIPIGTYVIDMNTVSPKYSSSSFYKTYANGSRVPRLKDVPGYDGILIHTGNTPEDTDGCILVGENKVVGQVINSRDTFKKIYPKLQAAKDTIYLEIKHNW